MTINEPSRFWLEAPGWLTNKGSEVEHLLAMERGEVDSQ
jgi:hypothetical protein